MQKDDIIRLATLARINITEKEITNYLSNFNSILNMIDSLKDLEVDMNRFKQEGFSNLGVMRQDISKNNNVTNIDTTQIINRAKDVESNFIKVKKIIGE